MEVNAQAAPVENIGLCRAPYGGDMDKPAQAEPQDPAADVVAITRAALLDPIKRARLVEQYRMYRALAAAGMIPPLVLAGRP